MSKSALKSLFDNMHGRVIIGVMAIVLCFGASPAAAWEAPNVEITSPSDGDAVSGIVAVSIYYSIENGSVHTLRLLIDNDVVASVAVGQRGGTYVFTWDSTTVGAGPHVMAVRAYAAAPPSDHFNTDSININVFNAVCNLDADCDDGDAHTADACVNPGAPDAVCVHDEILCLNDGECDDGNVLTLADCLNPGTPDANCLHTPYACNTNADCDDRDTHTADSCTNGGTAQAACAHDAIACLSDNECDDENGLTLNSCLNPGTTAAACSYTPIDCNINADCDDDDVYTADTCAHGGTMSAACSHEAVACISNADCDDDNALTIDSCSEAGSALSMCAHMAFACNTSKDCDDSNAATDDICENGGTPASSCAHGAIACMNDGDCDDGDNLTLDNCTAAGTVNAACVHDPLSCTDDTDCDDDNALTMDTCEHSGTAQSSCGHTPIACNTATDCDDGNALTLDTCDSPGTAISACGHTPIECITDADCDDGDSNTTDVCELSDGTDSTCLHTPVEVEPEPESESLSLVVTTPVDGLITNQIEISVSGTVTPGALVTVNDLAVGIDASGAYIKRIPLIEGTNTIDVIACLADDCVSETRLVIRDTVAPEVGVAELDSGVVYVSLSDNPGGSGLNLEDANVSLDGDAATWIYDQTRKALRIDAGTLEIGTHAVTVSATDLAGNAVQKTVTFDAGESNGLHIEILDVPGRVIEEDAGMLMSLTLQEPQTQGWNIPALPQNSAQGFQDLLDEWYTKHTSGWPEGAFDFGKSKHEKLEIPSVECADVTANAPDIATETLELAVDGYVVAEVMPVASDVDESSIEVRIDGTVVPHEYDKKTKKIKAHVKGLKRGKHTAEVTAADTLGSTGTATTAFGVDPNIISMHLYNAINPSSDHIAAGQQFKVTLTMDEADFTGAWIILHNPDNASPSIGDGQIGQRYYIAATQPGSFDYEAIGYLYTSIDQTGQSATRIEAGIPLDDPPTTYLFASETLIIDNPPVSPSFWNAQFENLSTSSPNAFRLNDNYRVTSNGSQGVQGVIDMLLNFDTVAVGGNPSIAAVRTDNMNETPYGSGMYETASGSAVLDNLIDGTGASARVLLPLVCAPGSGENACAFGSLVYMDAAPVFNNIVLENLSAPGQPFTQPGQVYKVTVYGDVATPHLPYLQTLLMNADRIAGGFDNIDPTMAPMLTLTQTSPGVYEATGILDDFIDNDGQTSNRVVAVATVASFFEYTLSNQIEIQQQPPQIEITSVHIRNTTYPDRATVSVGEAFEVISESDPGLTLTCQVFGVRINGSGNGAVTTLPMTETLSGHYNCSGTVSVRPDVEGLPADLLFAAVDTGIPGVHGRNSDDFLTYRGTIIEAHLSNASRPDAIDIAPGEKIKIIAIATPGLGSINGGLLDARIHNSPLPGGPFLQTTDPLVEYPIGSGQYSVETVLLNVPDGLTTIRGYAGNIASDDPLVVVLTTETLDILAEPPIPPTTITNIDSVPVANNEATSNNLEPVVEGTAPTSATVNIYELIPGGSIGNLDPVSGGPALSATAIPPGVVLEDDFNDPGQSQSLWDTSADNGGNISFVNSAVEMQAVPGNNSMLWMKNRFTSTGDFFTQIDIQISPQGLEPSSGISLTVETTHDQGPVASVNFNWSGNGSLALNTESGAPPVIINYGAPTPGGTYTMRLDYNQAAGTTTGSINGVPLLITAPGYNLQGMGLYNRIDLNNWSAPGGNTVSISIDNFTSNIPVTGYNISGPAMEINGISYDLFGNGTGLLINPCGEEKPTELPTSGFSCINNHKDILVILATLTNLNIEENLIPRANLTLYSAGSQEGEYPDQFSAAISFFNILKSQGIIAEYNIDAYATALIHPSGGLNNDYTPATTPIPAQLLICGEQPGANGYLRWDANQNEYLASYTPLAYQGTNYDDYVIWGATEDNKGPNVIFNQDAPIWWAKGNDDVLAAATRIDPPGLNVTLYATASLFAQSPNDLTFISQPTIAFTAKGSTNDYDWNAAALTAAGISPAPTSVCNGYGRNLIATTTADANNAYATQTISLQTYTDHLLYAESINTGTGGPLGHSTITTYHIQQATGTVDTTPPIISNLNIDPIYISPTNPTSTGTADFTNITASVTDQSFFDWKVLIRNPDTNMEWEIAAGSNSNVLTTWNGTDEQGSPLLDGTYEVIVAAMDTAPGSNYAQVVGTVRIDDTQPATVTFIEPSTGAVIGGVASVRVHALDSPGGTGIQALQVGVSGQGGSLVLATLEANDIYTAQIDVTGYSDGPAQLFARGTDAAGNQTESQLSVIIDGKPPVFDQVYPPTTPYNTNTGNQYINLTVSDGTGTGVDRGTLTCSITGNACRVLWIGESRVNVTFTAPLGNGTHSVALAVADKAGNIGTHTVTFIVDTTAPEITNVFPGNGSYINTSQPSISATLSDPLSGINETSVVLILDGNPISASYDSQTGILTTSAAGITDGSHTFTVSASDKAGNRTEKTNTFNIDTLPPSGLLNPQAWPDTIGVPGEVDDDGTIRLTWDPVEDNSGGSGITTYYAGINDGTAYNDAGSDLEDEDTTTQNGTVSYCVYAVDHAGNQSTPECDTINIAVNVLIVGDVSDAPDPISPLRTTTQPTSDSTDIHGTIYGQGLTGWTVEFAPVSAPGSVIAVLPVGGPGTDANVAVTWYGKNNSGVFLPDGNYIYTIKPQGGTNPPIPAQGTVTIDNTFPVSQILNLSNNQQLQVSNFTVEVGVTENLAVESVVLLVDNNESTTCQQNRIETGGRIIFTCEWAVSQESAGQHNIAARVTDSAKNTQNSPTVRVKTSQMPVPEVSITTPAVGVPIHGQIPVNVHFELKQGMVKWLDLYISSDGANYTPAVPTHNFTSPFQSTGDYLFTLDSTTYSDGLYYLKAEAHKTPSQSAESPTVQVLIDNTPVVISDLTPARSAGISPQSIPTSVIVSAVLSDGTGSGVDHATLSVNDGMDAPIIIRNILYKLTAANTLTGQNYGTYTLILKVYDKAGNVTVIDDWTYTIAPRPIIHSVCPKSGPAGSDITITGENFSNNASFVAAEIGYMFPTQIFQPAQVISASDTQIIIRIPENTPVSNPLSYLGLAKLKIQVQGSQADYTTFQVTDAPIHNDALIYVANHDSHSITVIDGVTGKNVATIYKGLEGMPLTDIAVSPDGAYIYALSGGDGISDQDKKLAIIETGCDTVVSTIDGVEGYDLTLSPDGSKLYAWNGNNVTVIDAAKTVTDSMNAIITTTPAGSLPGYESMFDPAGLDLYTMSGRLFRDNDSLIETDPYNAIINTLTTTYSDADVANAHAMDMTPDGRYLLAYYQDTDNIVVYSLASQEQVTAYSIPNANKLRVHPDGTHLYVTTSTGLTILDLDIILQNDPDNALIETVPITGIPGRIIFSNDGATAYVATRNAAQVYDPYAGNTKTIDAVIPFNHNELIQGQQPQQNPIISGYNPIAMAIQPSSAPHIDLVSPEQGYVGEQISITGSHFSLIPEHNIVLFNDVRGEVLTSSENEITVKVPAEAISGNISVLTYSLISNSVLFTALAPELYSITPNTGNPSDEVNIKGSGFSDVLNENNVYFNGVMAQPATATFATLTVTIPPYAQSGDVHVEVGGKQSNSLPFTVQGHIFEINDPITGAVFDTTSDTDANNLNGVQINVSIHTDYVTETPVKLVVSSGFTFQTYDSMVILDTAQFKNVTLYPGDNTIRAYTSKSEDIVDVVLNFTIDEAKEVVFTCQGDCGVGQPGLEQSLFVKQMPDGMTEQLPGTTGGDMAAWRADGGKLVFVKPVQPDIPLSPTALYTYDRTSQSVAEITDSDGNHITAMHPVWSPDGNYIAYYTNVTGCGFGSCADVVVIAVDSNGLRIDGPELVAEGVSALQSNPVWSPNSHYLFVSPAPSQQGQQNGISLIRIQGTNPIQSGVIHTGLSQEIMDWVPGTNSLASSLVDRITYLSLDSIYQVLQTPVYKSSTGEIIDGISISPDYTKLLYSSLNISGQSADIFLFDMYTGKRTPFINDSNVRNPDWRIPQYVVHNSVPPTFTDFTPDNFTHVNESRPVISARVETAVSRFACDITAGLKVDGEDVSSQTSYNEFTGRISYTPDTDYAPGHVIVAEFTATDCVGLVGTETLIFAINVPPEIVVKTPTPSSAINGDSIQVSARFADSEGMSSSTIVLGIDGIGPDIGTFDPYSGVVSYDASLAEGVYHATVYGEDKYGASATAAWEFQVDRTPPVLVVVERTPGQYEVERTPKQYYESKDAPAFLSAVWTDGATGSGVATDSQRFYFYQLNPPYKTVIAPIVNQVADGTEMRTSFTSNLNGNVLMYVEDLAGNKNEDFWLLQVDSTAPVITPKYPMHNGIVRGIGGIDFNPLSVVIEDEGTGMATNSLVFTITDGTGPKCVYSASLNTCSCSVSIISKSTSILYCYKANLPDGDYYVSVDVEDNVENSSTLDASDWHFRVDSSLTEDLIPGIRDFTVSRIDNITENNPEFTIHFNEPSATVDANNLNVIIRTESGVDFCTTSASDNACNCTSDNDEKVILCHPDTPELSENESYLINVTIANLDAQIITRTWRYLWNGSLSDEQTTVVPELGASIKALRQVRPESGEKLAVTYTLDTNSKVSLDISSLGTMLEDTGDVKTVLDQAQQARGLQLIAPIAAEDANNISLAAGAYQFNMTAELDHPACAGACPRATLNNDFEGKPVLKDFTFMNRLNPMMNEPLELSLTLDEPGQILFQVGIEDGALYAQPEYWTPYPAGRHALSWDGRADNTPWLLVPEKYFYIIYELALHENDFLVYGNENKLDILSNEALSVNPDNFATLTISVIPSVDSFITAKLMDDTTYWENPLAVLSDGLTPATGGATATVSWDGLVNNATATTGIYTIGIEAASQSDSGNVTARRHLTVAVRSAFLYVSDGTLYIVPNPGEIVYNVTQTDDAPTPATTVLAESTIPGGVVAVPIQYFESGQHTFSATFYNTITGAPLYTKTITSTFQGGVAP